MELDLNKIKKVFYVGIGGIGISAIARMMLKEGKEVYGSDTSEGEVVAELKNAGAEITIGQGFELIPEGTDLIVYTIAIESYDPDLYEKVVTGLIPARSYPEMLEIVTKGKNTIAISGTHGKTTTTAMIAKILIDAKKDPTVIVGSLLKDTNSNLISGKSDLFVVEACEYRRSFLHIHPKILVITNIEADHLDYYKDLADIQDAFSEMISQIAEGGALVCDPNHENIAPIISNIKCKVIDYTKYLESVPKLSVPGEHNRIDAAAALAVAEELGILKEEAEKSVQKFQGTWRRLEKRGEAKDGTILYDDYAHHPTEIKASLQALRELYPSKKLIIIFQSHLYSRTKSLWEGFVEAFDGADQVFILPVYAAREMFDPTVSPEKLAEAIAGRGKEAKAFADFDEGIKYFNETKFGENDVIVTMGAGEAYKVTEGLDIIK